MALWDLFGKRDKKSLREMLGGVRDKVEVGVSVGLQESPEVLVRTVTDYVASGYARIKIKIKPGQRCRRCNCGAETISRYPFAGGREFCLLIGVGAIAQTVRRSKSFVDRATVI